MYNTTHELNQRHHKTKNTRVQLIYKKENEKKNKKEKDEKGGVGERDDEGTHRCPYMTGG